MAVMSQPVSGEEASIYIYILFIFLYSPGNTHIRIPEKTRGDCLNGL